MIAMCEGQLSVFAASIATFASHSAALPDPQLLLRFERAAAFVDVNRRAKFGNVETLAPDAVRKITRCFNRLMFHLRLRCVAAPHRFGDNAAVERLRWR